jgi:fructokinase
VSTLCLGEAIADLVCERPLAAGELPDCFVPHRGGALANVAIAIQRGGGKASLFGGVGDDPWGQWLLEGLQREGVDCGFVERVEGLATPIALISFDQRLEPRFQVYGETISETIIAASGHLEEALDRAEALVFGSNTLVGEPERELTIRARRGALDRGLPILFDPNLRANRWTTLDRAIGLCRELFDGALVVRANREEAALLTGEEEPAAAAEELCRLGAGLGVVTLGPEGALMRGATVAEAPSPEVAVVAPLGAGDAFMGALCASLARSDWQVSGAGQALAAATAAGAGACSTWGAQG